MKLAQRKHKERAQRRKRLRNRLALELRKNGYKIRSNIRNGINHGDFLNIDKHITYTLRSKQRVLDMILSA